MQFKSRFELYNGHWLKGEKYQLAEGEKYQLLLGVRYQLLLGRRYQLLLGEKYQLSLGEIYQFLELEGHCEKYYGLCPK